MRKFIIPILLVVLTFGTAYKAAAEGWTAGIGTGFFGLNIDGTQGVNLPLLGGATELDLKMDPDEVREYTDSAIGFGGFAAKGKWKVLYSYVSLEMGDSVTGLVGTTPVSASVTFTATGAELAAVRRIGTTGRHAWGALGGLRYIKHELDGSLTIPGPTTTTRSIDESWTDVLVGLTHDYPISSKWAWNNRLDIGVGGSDLSANAKTGASWHFAKSWLADFYGSYYNVDFENGSKGDADWYLYDASEYGVGVSIV
jgi:hypothetical protein